MDVLGDFRLELYVQFTGPLVACKYQHSVLLLLLLYSWQIFQDSSPPAAARIARPPQAQASAESSPSLFRLDCRSGVTIDRRDRPVSRTPQRHALCLWLKVVADLARDLGGTECCC